MTEKKFKEHMVKLAFAGAAIECSIYSPKIGDRTPCKNKPAVFVTSKYTPLYFLTCKRHSKEYKGSDEFHFTTEEELESLGFWSYRLYLEKHSNEGATIPKEDIL